VRYTVIISVRDYLHMSAVSGSGWFRVLSPAFRTGNWTGLGEAAIATAAYIFGDVAILGVRLFEGHSADSHEDVSKTIAID
jgi:hypothetical protein